MSALAVFIALGGTGYAVTTAKNTVGHQQIKQNAVRAPEIKAKAVRGAEIRDGAVGAADVGDDSLTGAELFDGSVGSADVGELGSDDIADQSLGSADIAGLGSGDIEDGSLGTQDLADEAVTGSKVDDGTLTEQDAATGSFLAGEVKVYRVDGTANDGTSLALFAECQENETLIGGSVNLQIANHADARITVSRPSADGAVPESGAVYPGGFNEWKGTVFNPADGGAAADFRVWAICTENAPPPPPPPEPPPPAPPLPPGGPPPPPPPED